MCACAPCVCVTKCLWKLERALGAPGTGVIESCEQLCRYWELNLGPLQEQLVLLTTESSSQTLERDLLF